MALSLAAAALGSAVIGGAVGLHNASQAKKAANKTLEANQVASQQQLAAQQAALDRITGLNQRFIDGGGDVFDMLLREVGGSGQGAAPGGGASYGGKTEGGFAGVSPQEPQLDWNGYAQANPDLTAEFQRLSSTPDGQAYLQQVGVKDAAGFAKFHYDNFNGAQAVANGERPAPPTLQQAPAAPTAPDLRNAPRPEGTPLTLTQRPNGPSAPSLPSVDWRSIQDDPGFQWETQQAGKGVNAFSAVRGKLRSGDAALELQKQLYGVAHSKGSDYVNRSLNLFDRANQQYQFDANRTDNNFNTDEARRLALGQFNLDRGDRNFTTDRSFQEARDNTRTGNLFDLANIGLRAAGNVSGAAQSYANNATDIYGSQAQSASDAAYAKAQANSQLFGSLGGAATNLFTNWGGPSTTAQNPFNQGFNPAPNANPAGFKPFVAPVF